MNVIFKAFRKPKKAFAEAQYSVSRALGGTNYQPFIILTRSRTGSTLLSSSLNSHPNVRCRAEVFNRLRGRNFKRVLKSVYGKHAHTTRAAGFKIFYYHPNDADGTPIWEALAKIENLKIIHLTRKNILRTLVSRKIAGTNNEYQHQEKHSSQQPKSKTVHFCPMELESEIASTVDMENSAFKYFSTTPILPIVYEEMISNPQSTFTKVQQFLNVPVTDLDIYLKQQNPEPLSNLIENYAELRHHFNGTNWSQYLDN